MKDAAINAARLDGNVTTVTIPYRGADTNKFISAAAQQRGLQSITLPASGKSDFFSTTNRETGSERTYQILGAINLSVTITSSTCGANNGSMIIVPDGGTPPYSFDIGDGATYRSGNFPNKAAGTYMVKVTDAKGEKAITEVSIENLYPKPTLKASSYSAAKTCSSADATITLEATGGVPPYEYSYDGVHYQSSNVFTNLYGGLYIFSVRDANGCIGTLDAFNVSYLMGFNCEATGFAYSSVVCSNEGFITASGGGPNKPYTYSLDGVTYQSSGEFTNLVSGVYQIYFKDATGKVQMIVVPIYQSCRLEVRYISVAAACGANDGSLTVNVKKGVQPYSYSIDGIHYQSSNTFTGLAPGTYYITVKDANGFTNSSSATVYDRCPLVSVNTTNETCVKNDGSIEASAVKGTEPYLYSIDGVNFQTTPTFNGLKKGSYTVTLKDAYGFTSTATVTINDGCILVSASITNASCGQNNGALTVSAINGTPPYSYSIDGVNYRSSGSFSALAAGTYIVSVKDAGGKTGSTTATISNESASITEVTTVSSSCLDNDGVLTIFASGTNPLLYSIDGSHFQTNSAFKGLSAGSYVVKVKDGNGCEVSQPITLETNCPCVSVTVKDETCNNRNGVITVAGDKGIAPYSYSVDGIRFQTDPVFYALSAGSYTVTIKDALGSINTTKVSLANICPVVTLSALNGKCTLTGGVIIAEGTKGTPPYTYSLDGINFQEDNRFNNLTSGAYSITVKDANGLTSATTVKLQNFPGPSLSVDAEPATCLNNDGVIVATGTEGTLPLQYSVDGMVFQTNDVFSKISSGKYQVIVKDANGCTSEDIVTVPLSDNLFLNAPQDVLLLCEGSSVPLQLNTNAESFVWLPTAGLNNNTAQNPTASPKVTTTYLVQATLGACKKETSVTLVVNPAPVPVALGDTTICFGQSTILKGSGGISYQWTPAVYLTNAASPTPQVISPKASTTYCLKVRNDNGCESLSSASVKVIVTPPAKISVGNDTSVVINQPFQLMAKDVNGSGFLSYTWYPSEGLSNSSIQNPIFSLNRDMHYRVTGTTASGCQGSGEVLIKVYKGPEIYVPNAFTPNRDGKNDVLKPVPVGIKLLNYFVIYNRYGETVFSSRDSTNGWDGAYKNVLQATGVFVWMAEGVDDKGNIVKRKGTVTLIRK